MENRKERFARLRPHVHPRLRRRLAVYAAIALILTGIVILHILRDRSIVRTDREVTVVEGRRSLSGRGMEFNAESRELVLHGDVRARFEAEKK